MTLTTKQNYLLGQLKRALPTDNLINIRTFSLFVQFQFIGFLINFHDRSISTESGNVLLQADKKQQ